MWRYKRSRRSHKKTKGQQSSLHRSSQTGKEYLGFTSLVEVTFYVELLGFVCMFEILILWNWSINRSISFNSHCEQDITRNLSKIYKLFGNRSPRKIENKQYKYLIKITDSYLAQPYFFSRLRSLRSLPQHVLDHSHRYHFVNSTNPQLSLDQYPTVFVASNCVKWSCLFTP